MKQLTQRIGQRGKKQTGRLGKLSRMLLLSLLPVTCFAGSNVTPESIVKQIIEYLSGDLALTVGALAVIGAGYAFIFKQAIEKQVFVRIVVGMSLVLGGATIADYCWGGA